MVFRTSWPKNGGFGEQNRGRGGAILIPNELVFLWGFGVCSGVSVKIDQEMRS